MPTALFPKDTLLRYISRICDFEKRRSTENASNASVIFRWMVGELSSRRTFTSCWVIVEAPSTVSCALISTTAARAIPAGSTPGSE